MWIHNYISHTFPKRLTLCNYRIKQLVPLHYDQLSLTKHPTQLFNLHQFKMSASNTTTYDFSETKFDGGCRQSHQFRPFIMAQLQADGLTWVLNTEKYPDKEIPIKIRMIMAQQQLDTEHNIQKYEQEKREYERHLEEFKAEIDAIVSDPSTTKAEKTFLLDRFEQDQAEPVEPRVAFPMSELTPAMERIIQDVEIQNLKLEKASSKALEIMKKFLSQRLLNAAQKILEDEIKSPRDKLLAVWEWIKTFQYNDMKVVQEIRSDITNLPTIATFHDAIISIQKINLFQRELVTMGKGLTDTELIMTHTGKLNSDRRFTNLKLKYLQGELSTVAGSEPKWITMKKEEKHPIESTYTWGQYTEDVNRYHRNEGTVDDESHAVAMAAQTMSHQSEEIKSLRQLIQDGKDELA